MLLYVLSVTAGIAFGLLLTQKAEPLLLLRLRGLYLLVPAIFTAMMPLWLGQTAPEQIWADDRQLLIMYITLQQGFLILFLLLNLMPRHLPIPQRWRLILRRLQSKMFRVLNRILQVSHLHPIIRRVIPSQQPATRWWHRLPLIPLLIAVIMQTAVLLQNEGYMPLTPAYLDRINNPALVAGIKNGALLLKRIVDNQTKLPQLAQSIRLPLVERIFPNAFPYYSPVELLGAVGLFLFIFSQFFAKIPSKSSKIAIEPTMPLGIRKPRMKIVDGVSTKAISNLTESTTTESTTVEPTTNPPASPFISSQTLDN